MQCWHQVKMLKRSTKLASFNRKYGMWSPMCMIPLQPPLGSLSCNARISKLNSRLPGWEACLTWVQLLALQFTSCENVGDPISLRLIFLMCK